MYCFTQKMDVSGYTCKICTAAAYNFQNPISSAGFSYVFTEDVMWLTVAYYKYLSFPL